MDFVINLLIILPISACGMKSYNLTHCMMKKVFIIVRSILAFSLALYLLCASIWQPSSLAETNRAFTRQHEFDYVAWSWQAFQQKATAHALGFVHYLSFVQQRKIISEHFRLLQEKNQLQQSLDSIYSDPQVTDPQQESALLRQHLTSIETAFSQNALLTEAVLQDQISHTLVDLDLSKLSQSFPPLLYRVSDLPKELIISPREIIKGEASISLQSDLTNEEIVQLEEKVEASGIFSALVVSVGGVGTYPSMVINTSDLSSLIETVAHEWIHNYLAFKPLGLRYSSSPQLRTMNETTASLAGKEIRQAVLKNFYSDLLYPDKELNRIFEIDSWFAPALTEPEFDFQQEMHETRIQVDALLEAGKIEEAEDFMEERRQLFWENGYQIRKLNQAYFAFHGAYADQPYSAAGEDPVGKAVRLLRNRSRNLADFIDRISRLTNEKDLFNLVYAY